MQVSNSRWFLPLLAVTSILFFWLGWPVLPFAPLLFLAFVPILMMEQHITAKNYRKPGLATFGWWYLTMLGWNLTTTWWVVNSTLIGGVFANLANAALMCIPLMLFRYTKHRTGPGLGYLSFVLYWLTFENIHLTWDLSWPWLTLGNGFAMFPEWVQWYEWTGVFGGSIWILLGNLLAYFMFWHGKPHFSAVTVVVMLFWIGLPILGSYIRYWSYLEEGPAYEAVVLQPNIDPFTEKFAGTENFIPFEEQVQLFIEQSQTQLGQETDFLLWPETAIDKAYDERYLNQQPIIQDITGFVNSYPNLALLTGITSYNVYESGIPPASARYQEGFGHYDVYNTAYYIHGDTDTDRKSVV